MIIHTIYIDKYDWRLRLFVSITKYDSDVILKDVADIGASDKLIKHIEESLNKDNVNTGFTYSNKLARSSVMVIGRSSSAKEEFNSVSHELRHLVDDIATTDNMHMGGEEVAYLTGDIAGMIFGYISTLLCCNCHK